MSKIITPAIERYSKKVRSGKQRKSTPLREVWKRLKRNKLAMVGLIVFSLLILIAVFPGLFATHRYDTQNYMESLQLPSVNHLMGTDNFGRDIFSRIIYGTRISLGIGVLSVLFALVTGGVLGAIAAFYGKKTDHIIMRFIDILQAIPSILMAISVAAALGKGVFNLMLALGISTIPLFSRIVRATVLTVKNKEYVEAGRCIGSSDLRLIFRHMIPNAMGPIIVQTTFGIATSILLIAGLSYIGLGIQPPTPEWGSMLADGKQYMQQYWHIMVFPGLALFLTSFSLNVLGDGLRDAFDPKLK